MNGKKIFGLLSVGALVFSTLFLSAPALAQTGSIEVTCEGPSGAPEKDVNVTVIPLNVAKGTNKKSGATGVASFDKLGNGAYRVVGRKAGFAPALYEFAVVNNSNVPVVLKLSLGADRKFYFEDPALERQANMLLDQGMKAIESGDAAEAEKVLSQALEIKPSGADILYIYGSMQEAQGKFEQALELFIKAADTANIMSAAPKPKQKPGGQASNYEMIAKTAEQHINMMPVLRAEAALGAKRFDEAVTLFDEAIKSNPQNPVLYSNKALALVQAGQLDEALATINRALELAPGNEQIGQIKKAIETGIENAFIQKANAILSEGTKLLESDDASGALKKFEEANALTGEKQPMIWRQVAQARARLKQDDEAITAFKKAIELAPADQLENYQMAFAQFYLNAKRPEEALDIVVAGSKDPEQRLMELFYRGKDNPNSAAFSLASLERVVKLNPANYDAAFELGQVYYIDRKDVQAQEMLTRYVENGKDDKKLQNAKDLLSVITSRINKSK